MNQSNVTIAFDIQNKYNQLQSAPEYFNSILFYFVLETNSPSVIIYGNLSPRYNYY